MKIAEELNKRRTFAIISHPDAGKTTLTEKLLLFGGAIQTAGAVKSNKIKKTATSDFMEIEKQRGISVATSVMVFNYSGIDRGFISSTGRICSTRIKAGSNTRSVSNIWNGGTLPVLSRICIISGSYFIWKISRFIIAMGGQLLPGWYFIIFRIAVSPYRFKSNGNSWQQEHRIDYAFWRTILHSRMDAAADCIYKKRSGEWVN